MWNQQLKTLDDTITQCVQEHEAAQVLILVARTRPSIDPNSLPAFGSLAGSDPQSLSSLFELVGAHVDDVAVAAAAVGRRVGCVDVDIGLE